MKAMGKTERLATLLSINLQLPELTSEDELAVYVVNSLRSVLVFDQACWFDSRGKLRSVSGVTSPNREAPEVINLEHLVKNKLLRIKKPKELTADDLPASMKKYAGQLWYPMLAPQSKKILGGMLLGRNTPQPWLSEEITLLDAVGKQCAFVTGRLQTERVKQPLNAVKLIRSRKWATFMVLLIMGAMFIPVRESVLAPATTTPRSPEIVSASFEGVISAFHIQPNQRVEPGQLLLEFDDEKLRNQAYIAQRAVKVAQAEYDRAEQLGFKDEESQSRLDYLQWVIKQKQAELAYANESLARTKAYAQSAGIALFNNPEKWIGKPLIVGEKVMEIADPDNVAITINVPVDDAINLETGAPVRVFLNVDPTSPINGEIYQTTFEPEIVNGTAVFPLKARVTSASKPRLGLKGTAKIYGNKVSLFYFLFRRPLSVIRRTFGL